MKHTILTLLVLFSWVFTPIAYAGNAPEIAEQPCDANYWRQLSARAWLEAEREIMQNQNLIFKPDSVLQYTCFDRALNVSAHAGGDIFVHTAYFGEKIIKRQTNYAMENVLGNVVYQSLASYLGDNYNHSFLGGRSEALQAGATVYELTPTSQKLDAYQCQNMSHVWRAAKCANFIDNEEFQSSDGFYPFEVIEHLTDPSKNVGGYADTIKEARAYPAGYECVNDLSLAGAGLSNEIQGWSGHLEVSDNRNQDLYQFQTPLGEIFKEVNDKTEPGNCAGNLGIKTGVTVVANQGDKGHPDGVCTNPGCSYTSTGVCKGSGPYTPPQPPVNPGPGPTPTPGPF